MRDVTAVLDACVLYPAPLRDFLMHLALLDAFRAKWSEAIHEEWIRNLLESRADLQREQLERTRELMNLHVRDALVENYESLIDTLELPDADDRHVLAAAIHTKAEAIITFNLRDFPSEQLEKYGIEAVNPDAFIVSLIEGDAETVIEALKNQQRTLKNPPQTLKEIMATLENNGLKRTVERLRLGLGEG